MSVARATANDRETMAEETRYRSPRAYNSPGQATAAADATRQRRGEDPLAELARLIGQEDPFAEFATAGAAPRRAAANGANGRAPMRAAQPTPDRRTAELVRRGEPRPASANGRTDDPTRTSRAPSPRIAADEHGAGRDRIRTNARQAVPQDDEYDPRSRRPVREEAGEDPRNARRSERPDARQTRGRHPAQDTRGYENDYDPEYVDDGYLPEHADDVYEDVPRPRRRWGLYILLFILFLSLTATAGLGYFAYRTVFDNNRPPVVTRSNVPTKVDPKAAPQTAVAPNKTIQDRIGPAGPDQILSREEQPADLTQTNRQQPLPFAGPQAQPAPQVLPQKNQPFTQAPPPNTANDAPRRVRTMTVRSDGTVVPNAAPNNAGPLPLNANQNSLEPDSPARNPRTAAIPQTTATGNYVVQVASHKTQQEAEAAWATLRVQHASIFTGRNADIRRVDLGDRGTFYRAMVGPMSRDQANALCQNLKVAGGGCIVQQR
jgi:cell division protein FtsN